ncbi:hypothetical protein AN958_10643 [Leucoagaricus sp. SymC.cos]|nr:hypothetical protein AN958_10643 [Leucoagaricus sp. SymC.cos]
MCFNGVWKRSWENIKEREEQELARQRKVASRLVSYVRTVSSRRVTIRHVLSVC